MLVQEIVAPDAPSGVVHDVTRLLEETVLELWISISDFTFDPSASVIFVENLVFPACTYPTPP